MPDGMKHRSHAGRIDPRNSEKSESAFAYYKDIRKIDTVYIVALTYSSYMLVTRQDNSKFKVYVDGKKEDVKVFFESAIHEWQKRTRQPRRSFKDE